MSSSLTAISQQVHFPAEMSNHDPAGVAKLHATAKQRAFTRECDPKTACDKSYPLILSRIGLKRILSTMISPKRCIFACATVMAAAAAATAQTPHDFGTWRPSAAATRIATTEAPAIDGDVSDKVWAKAPAISEFYQLEPSEGAPADERTVVRVLYDENNLYFAIEADDPSPVTARIKQRDGGIDVDDIIRIYLDPDMSRRNGYMFEVNPLGARREGLIQNNADVIYQWNTLWNAKARVTPKGWTAEVIIPSGASTCSGWCARRTNASAGRPSTKPLFRRTSAARARWPASTACRTGSASTCRRSGWRATARPGTPPARTPASRSVRRAICSTRSRRR
jgi:hypothetical protein